MKQLILSSLIALLPLSSVLGAQSGRTVSCPAAALDQGGPHQILACRYELEMRRAGGPRKEVLESILTTGTETGDLVWEKEILDACMGGLIDCREFVPLVSAVADHEKAHREAARGAVERIRQEAVLQAMSDSRRRAFYLKALVNGFAEDEGIRLDYRNAALRILDERMQDLMPRLQSELAIWPNPPSDLLENRVRIMNTLNSRDPQAGLLELVRAGILQSTDSPAELLAKRALRELRRLNIGGTAERLKEILQLYEGERERQENERRELLEKVQKERRPLLPHEGLRLEANAYLGVLGRGIVETIGDLGDREFERRTLNGETLWDRVHQAELELRRLGRLGENDMVTR